MVKDALYTALQALAAGNVFGGDAGDTPPRPYIVYFKVVGTPRHTLDAEVAGTEHNVFQIDVYAETFEAAETLHQQLRAAMAAASFKCVQLRDQDLFEPDTKLHRVLTEWSIWGL